MIRSNLQITAKPDTKRMRRAFERATVAIAQEAVRLSEPVMRRLTADPPESAKPSPWAWESEKQRKYVMALLRATGNLPYQRTGDAEKAWEGGVTAVPGGATVFLRNTWGKSKYLHGTFRSLKPQQRGHALAGRRPAREIKAEYFAEVRRHLGALYIETLKGFGLLKVGR